jgi:hypothetical protein
MLKARLEYAYLRYSIPLYYLKTKQKITNGEFINILPGGQVFYSRKDYPFYSDLVPYILKIQSRNEKYFSNVFITCFLKEKIFLINANKIKGLKRLGLIIEEHNKTIDELAYNIDKNIYKLCRLSDNDIRIIENYLKNNNIYLPVFEESKLCPTETVVLDQ